MNTQTMTLSVFLTLHFLTIYNGSMYMTQDKKNVHFFNNTYFLRSTSEELQNLNYKINIIVVRL